MSNASQGSGNTWATFLKAARKARGWSIDDLAAEADVSRMTIIRWEGGATGFKHETVERVARALEVPVDAALAAARGAVDGEPLPPPLPQPLARLANLYSEMGDVDRVELLRMVDLVNEWAEARLRRYGDDPRRRRRRTG